MGAFAIALDDLPAHLAEADLVVSSTGARQHLVSRPLMEAALGKRRRKPVCLIDLAVPADLDPKIRELSDCYLYTIDDLKSVIDENLKARSVAAEQAEAMLVDHAATFGRWLESRDVAPTIQALRARARFLHHSAQCVERRSPADNQSRTRCTKIRIEGGERLMEPPARGAARLPRRLLLQRVDEKRHDRPTSLHGFLKCGIIGQTQIQPQPDDGWGLSHAVL